MCFGRGDEESEDEEECSPGEAGRDEVGVAAAAEVVVVGRGGPRAEDTIIAFRANGRGGGKARGVGKGDGEEGA